MTFKIWRDYANRWMVFSRCFIDTQWPYKKFSNFEEAKQFVWKQLSKRSS